jgi:ATP-binding protein involved in chromosome partitioning
VTFLGEIPLHMNIRSTSDAGTPLVATQESSPHRQSFMAIAAQVAAKLGEAQKPAPRLSIVD